MMVRRDAAGVRLLTRRGNNWTQRYPPIAAAVDALRVRSCLIDGQAVACGDDGLPAFDRLRYRRHDASVFLYAFDLIELNGDDLRRDRSKSARPHPALSWPRPVVACGSMSTLEHEDGEVVFRHACKLGLEGIVSKRKGSLTAPAGRPIGLR
jgi:bifunctional non-homologous end joining protein LigD